MSKRASRQDRGGSGGWKCRGCGAGCLCEERGAAGEGTANGLPRERRGGGGGSERASESEGARERGSEGRREEGGREGGREREGGGDAGGSPTSITTRAAPSKRQPCSPFSDPAFPSFRVRAREGERNVLPSGGAVPLELVSLGLNLAAGGQYMA